MGGGVRAGEVVCTTQQQPFAVRWTANTVSRPTMNHTHTPAGPRLPTSSTSTSSSLSDRSASSCKCLGTTPLAAASSAA